MKYVISIALLIFICVSDAKAEKSTIYYTKSNDTFFCTWAKWLYIPEDGSDLGHDKCEFLPSATPVTWDGHTKVLGKIRNTTGFYAKVTLRNGLEDGLTGYIYEGDLTRTPNELPILESDRFITTKGAVLCLSPADIDEAYKAEGDKKWLKQLGCFIARGGLIVVRITPDSLNDLESAGQPWKVRLVNPGVDVWGYAFSFLRTNGSAIY